MVNKANAGAVDFSRRVAPKDLPELMDGPCSYEEFRGCLVDLEKVNRLSLGYRPTLSWLDDLVEHARTEKPLAIVDVGCGGGDMLRRVAAWARKRGVAVKLTGVDLNPYAARAAGEFARPGEEIEFVCGDAFSLEGEVDAVISSLLTHHLEDVEIVRFVRWMEATARRGWFVNDLCRESTPYYWYNMGAKVLGWHRFLKHDGPVSFRRSFREEDWRRMVGVAGIDGDEVSLRRWRPGRLCVGRLK